MRRLPTWGKKRCAALVVAAALLLTAPHAFASLAASTRADLLASPALQPITAIPALAPTYAPQGFALHLDADAHPATFALFNDLAPASEHVEPEKLASGVESWALTPNLQRIQIFVTDSRWCREFLGPIDSPSLYQAFGLDPMNMTDPLGLQKAPLPPQGVPPTSPGLPPSLPAVFPCPVPPPGAKDCYGTPKITVTSIVVPADSMEYKAALNKGRSLFRRILGMPEVTDEEVSILLHSTDSSGRGKFSLGLANGMMLAKPTVDRTFDLTLTFVSSAGFSMLGASRALPVTYFEGLGSVGGKLFVPPPPAAPSTGATFGTSTGTDYRGTFFAAHPELEGKVFVHHAVEQQTLWRFPGTVTESKIHSLENLRGIPKNVNTDVHLSQIRKEWNRFYRQNPKPTEEQLLAKATEIDQKFGAQFNPPVRHN